MLNLNSTIDLDLKKFWRWWRRELGNWVPEKIRQLISDKQGFIIVRPEAGQLILSYLYKGQLEPLAVLDRNEAGQSAYQALLGKDERLAKAQVVVRLTDREVIHKELVLPAAAKENLQQVIAYELDRYTPFKAEQIYFAAKALEDTNEPGQIKAILILTTREILDALYADIKAIGLVPLLIDYEGAANDFEQDDDYYNLLPEWLREKSARTPKLIVVGLLATVFLLLVTAMVLPVWLESQAVEALQEKIDEVEPEAKKVKAMQLEIDELIEQTQLLIAEKTARPPVVIMLNALSSLIKDDTSLTYAQYSEGHIQMQGESPAASGLIGVLEASDFFANARFVSPVTQDKVTGLERFQITVDVTKPPAVESESESEQGEPIKGAEPDTAAEEPSEPEANTTEPSDNTQQTGGSNDTTGQ